MDGEEDRDILPARTSSKPADTADQEINLDQKQTRPEETNRSKRRSILYGLDRSLDDLELDEDDDQERRPPRRDADNSRRKRKKSSVVNDANVAHDSNEPGKPKSAVRQVAAYPCFLRSPVGPNLHLYRKQTAAGFVHSLPSQITSCITPVNAPEQLNMYIKTGTLLSLYYLPFIMLIFRPA